MAGGLFWLQHMAPYGQAAPTGDTYAEVLLALTPTAYWRMGESSGDLTDSSGNSHTLTAGGTATYDVAGWPGDDDGAIDLAGTSYFRSANHTDYSFGTGDFSIAWVMKDPTWTTMQLFGHDGQGNLGQWELTLSAAAVDGVRLNIRDATTGSTTYDLNATADLLDDGSWHHCVITCDRDSATGLKFYVDGTLMETLDCSATSAYNITNTNYLYVGANSTTPGEPFTGSLDEVAFWKGTALSQANVEALYAAQNGTGGGSGGGETTQADTYADAVLALNPVAYYKMGEGSGTTMDDTSSTANHGTYVGSPTMGVAGPFDGASGITFDGASSQWAQAPYHANLDMGTGDWSIVLWMKSSQTWNTTTYQWLMSRGNLAGRRIELAETTSANRVACRVTNADETSTVYAFVDSSVSLHSGSWVMVVYTVDYGGNATLYVNGASQDTYDTSAYQHTKDDATAVLYLARATHAVGTWQGTLSQVAIFDSLLSAANVSALYAAGGF